MISNARRTQTARATKPVKRDKARRVSAGQREALLSQHIGLVHHVARQLARSLSTAAELDELVSAGSVGLIQAVDSFDTKRGLSFSTYAVPRIRGAILDELRKKDHMPRNVRRRTREITRARDTLTGRLHREPSEQELSTHLQVPAEVLRKWEFDSDSSNVSSLDQPIRSDEVSSVLADAVADDRSPSLDDILTHEYEVEQLKQAIGRLKQQERTVLALNYFEELKLQDIATVLGVSVCRVSQIRTAALAKLRVILHDLRAA